MDDMKIKKAIGATRFLEETLREMHAEDEMNFNDACEAVGEIRELIENYVKNRLFSQWFSE